MEKSVKEYFKKFYNMKPYLYIPEDEWQMIMETYEKDDVIQELSECLHTYPCPIPEISEEDTLKSLNKLKGVQFNDILVEGKWFPRNENQYNYPLTDLYFKKDNSGNNASNGFHIENRWKVDWVRTPSGWRTWQTVKGIKTIVRAFYTLEQVLTKVDLQSIRMATTLRKYVASQFKPSIAKGFYDYFKSVNVLDFSAGWGDRLAGFYCGETTKSFVGIDPNTNNHPNYQKQVEFYKKHQTFFEEPKEVELICSPAEDVDYTKYENYFDTIFTSPPYFNIEKYSDEDTQSYKRYTNIDRWNEDFLHSTLGKLIFTLKKDGIIAVNISDVYSAPDKGYLEICNPMNDYLKSQGMEYYGCIGMEMTKRFNSGGAGNAKSEYFNEELKEKTQETQNTAFGEPIWIWKKK
jgi:hypothetical protein|tara:strand:- start:596 stop:1810 length:1215 start_codon:yes stop_codon:yes gene_type:complete